MRYNWITISSLCVCAGASSPNQAGSVSRGDAEPGDGPALSGAVRTQGMTKRAPRAPVRAQPKGSDFTLRTFEDQTTIGNLNGMKESFSMGRP